MEELRQSVELVREKVQPLLDQVKQGQYETSDGFSYLEVKHILLLKYCEYLTFAMLLKAEGHALSGHPVLERLAEIRMFLEKIRPVEKKFNYQIEKLLKQAKAIESNESLAAETAQADDLKYKPNPDMLVSKMDDSVEAGGVYKPPKIAPTTMSDEEDRKERRMRAQGVRHSQHKARRSTYVKELQDELEGRPEEIRSSIGGDDKTLRRDIEKLEARARAEENMMARVPLSREERKRLKAMKRSRSGLVGIMDDFEDEIGGLVGNDEPLNDKSGGTTSRSKSKGRKNSLGVKKSKGKFKRKGRK